MTDDLESRLSAALDMEARRLHPEHPQAPPTTPMAEGPWWRRPRYAGPVVAGLAVVALVVVLLAVSGGGRPTERLTNPTIGPGLATPPTSVQLVPDLCPAPTVGAPCVPTTVSPTLPPAAGAATTSTVDASPDPSVAPPGALPATTAPPSSAAAPTTTAPSSTTTSVCSLTLGLGSPVSERTGQITVDLSLTNASGSSCTLKGYPGIGLLTSSSAALPFVYHDAGDQMVTGAAPQPVVVAPGQAAWVRINKYRCDVLDDGTAATVLATPTGAPTLSTPLAGAQRDLSYCGAGQPGSTVDISPIEATEAATGP